jgi:hypothetical protein
MGAGPTVPAGVHPGPGGQRWMCLGEVSGRLGSDGDVGEGHRRSAPTRAGRKAAIAVPSPDVWWTIGADGGPAAVTEDGGNHWTARRRLGLPPMVTDLDAKDQRTAWATAHGPNDPGSSKPRMVATRGTASEATADGFRTVSKYFCAAG